MGARLERGVTAPLGVVQLEEQLQVLPRDERIERVRAGLVPSPALGLAGVAVQAGARSALGSLWSISDEATAELISEFYRQLAAPAATRAQALQRAQAKLREDARFGHPFYWSPFLVINNWL